MVAQPKNVDVADFMAMPNDGNRHEFVRGEIRSMPPPKGQHGAIENYVSTRITAYLFDQAEKLGLQSDHGRLAIERLVGLTASGEFGFKFSTGDDPEQIRGADFVYVPAEQLAAVDWDREQYFPAVPWLVVEIISPSDLAADVAERVQDYLAGGARRVWCIYPQQRAVHVHAPDGPTRVLRGDNELTDEELLPGFSLPVAWLF